MNENKRHLISADLTRAKFTNFILITKISSQYLTRGKSRHFIILILKVRMTQFNQLSIQFWTIEIIRFFFLACCILGFLFITVSLSFWDDPFPFEGPLVFEYAPFFGGIPFFWRGMFLLSGYFFYFLRVSFSFGQFFLSFWEFPFLWRSPFYFLGHHFYFLRVSLSLREFLSLGVSFSSCGCLYFFEGITCFCGVPFFVACSFLFVFLFLLDGFPFFGGVPSFFSGWRISYTFWGILLCF